MAKKKLNKKTKQEKEFDDKPEYVIEYEKLKEELIEHEKNLEILKQDIVSLKKLIKLGSIAQS